MNLYGALLLVSLNHFYSYNAEITSTESSIVSTTGLVNEVTSMPQSEITTASDTKLQTTLASTTTESFAVTISETVGPKGIKRKVLKRKLVPVKPFDSTPGLLRTTIKEMTTDRPRTTMKGFTTVEPQTTIEDITTGYGQSGKTHKEITTEEPRTTLKEIATEQPRITFKEIVTEQPRTTFKEITTGQPAVNEFTTEQSTKIVKEVTTGHPRTAVNEFTTEQSTKIVKEVTTGHPRTTFKEFTTGQPRVVLQNKVTGRTRTRIRGYTTRQPESNLQDTTTDQPRNRDLLDSTTQQPGTTHQDTTIEPELEETTSVSTKTTDKDHQIHSQEDSIADHGMSGKESTNNLQSVLNNTNSSAETKFKSNIDAINEDQKDNSLSLTDIKNRFFRRMRPVLRQKEEPRKALLPLKQLIQSRLRENVNPQRKTVLFRRRMKNKHFASRKPKHSTTSSNGPNTTDVIAVKNGQDKAQTVEFKQKTKVAPQPMSLFDDILTLEDNLTSINKENAEELQKRFLSLAERLAVFARKLSIVGAKIPNLTRLLSTN